MNIISFVIFSLGCLGTAFAAAPMSKVRTVLVDHTSEGKTRYIDIINEPALMSELFRKKAKEEQKNIQQSLTYMNAQKIKGATIDNQKFDKSLNILNRTLEKRNLEIKSISIEIHIWPKGSQALAKRLPKDFERLSPGLKAEAIKNASTEFHVISEERQSNNPKQKEKKQYQYHMAASQQTDLSLMPENISDHIIHEEKESLRKSDISDLAVGAVLTATPLPQSKILGITSLGKKVIKLGKIISGGKRIMVPLGGITTTVSIVACGSGENSSDFTQANNTNNDSDANSNIPTICACNVTLMWDRNPDGIEGDPNSPITRSYQVYGRQVPTDPNAPIVFEAVGNPIPHPTNYSQFPVSESTWEFYVVAINEAGTSAPSSIVRANTVAQQPATGVP